MSWHSSSKAYTQVAALLPGMAYLFINISPQERSKVLLSEKTELIRQAYESLLLVREELLRIKVKRKNQVHGIHRNETIRRYVADFESVAEKYHERTDERGRLIDRGL